MTRMPTGRACLAAVVCAAPAVAALLDSPLRAQGAEWIIESGTVRVVCPLTIGGSFEAKTSSISGALRLAPVIAEPAEGEVVVDLDTLDTDIALRNEHLRDHYLEVGKGAGYARAVLTGIRLEGIDAATLTGRGRFSGTLRLHGVEQPVAGRVELRRDGAGLQGRAEFSVTLPDFSIARPRYLGVGVKDQVTARVTFEAVPAGRTRS
jgi:polyisoprenoid-binding protein YceI